MKIRLIVPCSNQEAIRPEVTLFLNELQKSFPRSTQLEIVRSKNSLPSRGRNEGITMVATDLLWPFKSIGSDIDVFAFLDSDVKPDVHAYISALTKMNRDTFSTGLYLIRGESKVAAGLMEGFNPVSLGDLPSRYSYKDADWAGGGLLFVGANVMREVTNPFFHESVVQWEDDNGIHRSCILGEDVTFCMKVTSTGRRLKVLPQLVAEHLV